MDNRIWTLDRPCKWAKAVGIWDDDCCNKKSTNYGCYDVTGEVRLEHVCRTCPDYDPEDTTSRRGR